MMDSIDGEMDPVTLKSRVAGRITGADSPGERQLGPTWFMIEHMAVGGVKIGEGLTHHPDPS